MHKLPANLGECVAIVFVLLGSTVLLLGALWFVGQLAEDARDAQRASHVYNVVVCVTRSGNKTHYRHTAGTPVDYCCNHTFCGAEASNDLTPEELATCTTCQEALENISGRISLGEETTQ